MIANGVYMNAAMRTELLQRVRATPGGIWPTEAAMAEQLDGLLEATARNACTIQLQFWKQVSKRMRHHSTCFCNILVMVIFTTAFTQ